MKSAPYSKILKVYNLLINSEGGENQAAKEALDRLLNKYNLSFEEIEDSFEEEVSRHYFKYKGKDERKLLIHIIWKVAGVDEYYVPYSGSRLSKTKISCECTESQSVEIEFLFEFYRNLYKKEVDVLLEAFINKHDLFGDSNLIDSDDKEIDYERLHKIMSMMKGLSDEVPVKLIEE